jgi:hypothetical protein
VALANKYDIFTLFGRGELGARLAEAE